MRNSYHIHEEEKEKKKSIFRQENVAAEYLHMQNDLT